MRSEGRIFPTGPPSDVLVPPVRIHHKLKKNRKRRVSPAATPAAYSPPYSVRVKQSIEDVSLGWEKKQWPVRLGDLQERDANFPLVYISEDNVRALEDAPFGGVRHRAIVVGVEEDSAVPPNWNDGPAPVPYFTSGGF